MKNATTVGARFIGAYPAKKVGSYRLAGMASMTSIPIERDKFILRGTAAALIFDKIFSPALLQITGVLAALAAKSTSGLHHLHSIDEARFRAPLNKSSTRTIY